MTWLQAGSLGSWTSLYILVSRLVQDEKKKGGIQCTRKAGQSWALSTGTRREMCDLAAHSLSKSLKIQEEQLPVQVSVVTGHTKPWKIKNSNQWLGLVSKDITDVYTENWSWILIPLGTVHIILNVRSLPVRGWSEGRGWEGEHNWNNLNDEGQKSQTMTSQQTRHGFVPQYCTMKCFISYREHTSYLVFYLILISVISQES